MSEPSLIISHDGAIYELCGRATEMLVSEMVKNLQFVVTGNKKICGEINGVCPFREPTPEDQELLDRLNAEVDSRQSYRDKILATVKENLPFEKEEPK